MTKTLSKEIAFNGKLRTSVDGASIGPNDFQVLKNLRYTDTNVRGVQGHTKVNTTVLAETAIRNGIHFRKDQPTESHIVVDANGKCYDNGTAVPDAGDFDSTPIYTDAAGATTGRYAIAPTGMLARCTSKESLLWGGDEYRAASLIDYPTTGQIYDYTDLICNSNIADSTHSATIHGATNAIDGSTVLLLHCDGTNNGTTFTDSSADPPANKTVTAYTGAVTSTTQIKFGTASGYFPGTGYLTVPDHADFDFSDGTWTVDFWVYPTDLSTQRSIYYQQTDANNYIDIKLAALAGGTVRTGYSGVALSIYSANSEVVSLYTGNSTIRANTWSHIAIVESGDNYYIFINGNLIASTSDTNRAANFTGLAQIGYDNTYYYAGYIDELRVSNTARWTSSFSPPSSAYGTTYASTTYLGSILPIKGFKATVNTANTQTSTMEVSYWNGSGWAAVSSLVDGTSTGGKSLAQTGTVTFTSTVSTSKLREIEKSVAHWYRIIVSGAAASFTAVLTNVTVDVPMQPIQDLWDGEDREIGAFVLNKTSRWSDCSVNVLKNELDEANVYTYTPLLSSFSTSDYALIGSNERAMGFNISIVSEKPNTTPSQLTVDYWNGSAWTSVVVNDGTIDGTCTFAKSGMVTWTAPAINEEYKQTGFSSKYPTGETKSITKGFPMYFYRIKFTGGLSANMWVYYISIIPAPADIRGYLFPMEHAGRLLLCNNVDGFKNSVKYSNFHTANVFNGEDAGDLYFGGDEGIVAGKSIYNRFGSTVTNISVLCKRGETWILQGEDPENWKQFQISDNIGCVAPQSMVAVNVPSKENTSGLSANAAVWVSSRGVEMFNGGSITLISGDIDDLFDSARSTYLGASTIATITGFYDAKRSEYHIGVPGSAEYVFDFHRGKWFQIVRGTELYGGFPVSDTSGNQYCYVYGNAGYVFRDQYGTTFDGTAIAHTLRTGDMAFPDGSIMEWSQVNWFDLIAKAKTVTFQNIAMVYYNDTGTTSYGSTTITPIRSGYRLINTPTHNKDIQTTFHGFQFSISTGDETIGFEPLYLGIRYTVFPRELS